MPRRRNWLAWIGLAVGLLGVVSYFAWIVLRVAPRAQVLRDTALLNLAMIGVGLGLSAIAVRRAYGRRATHRGRILAPLLGAVNVAVAVLFVFMLYRFAELPDTPNAPRVGDVAPAISLLDHRGQPFELSAERGRNVLLVFYRGHW